MDFLFKISKKIGMPQYQPIPSVALDPGVDPVGTFVGGRGIRVQAVMNEIGDKEKIDIITWSDNASEYIREALDVLGAARIDHGVRAIEDADLVQRLAREEIPLTVCPLSNLRLCVFSDMAQHTLAHLLSSGVRVTLNSDDPAYFGGYMNDNLRAVHKAFQFDAQTWYRLARNSFEASFVSAAQKAEWVEQLDAYFRQHGVTV